MKRQTGTKYIVKSKRPEAATWMHRGEFETKAEAMKFGQQFHDDHGHKTKIEVCEIEWL